MFERRSQKRFKIEDDIYIYSSSPSAAFIGKILDISRTGISFSYVLDFPAPDDLNELGIIVRNTGPVLHKLPFKTISDIVIQSDPPSILAMRRRSGRFHSLTPAQERELERFIENYARVN